MMLLVLCRIKTTEPRSILFGLEKSGSLQLIATAHNILTDNSRAVLAGLKQGGQPPKLKRRLATLAAAFSRRATGVATLPWSIQGLWKADLFVGSVGTQQWVGTSVKINPAHLEAAPGLRIGIVPTRAGRSDKVVLDQKRGLVVCPLHHDQDFMQIFYGEGFRVVQAFLAADAKIPKELLMPGPVEREVCRILEQRREFPVTEVMEALVTFGQPELLDSDDEQVDLLELKGDAETATMIAPVSRITKPPRTRAR